MKIDVKSLIIGVLLTAVVFLALGAAHSTGSHPCIRYLVEASQNNAYVIDTTTGQVWSRTGTGSREFHEAKNLAKQADKMTLKSDPTGVQLTH